MSFKKNENINEKKEVTGISRREFIKGAAASAVGIAALGILPGCSPTEDQNDSNSVDSGSGATAQGDASAAASTEWAGTAPEIADSKISNTLNADVVIVGAGVAGLSAARAASEAGASVIVVEKGTTIQYRSGEYGSIGNKIQKKLGMEVDKTALINEVMKQMSYRADQRIWEYWADHSGEDYDWLIELAPDYEIMPEDALTYNKDKITIMPIHWPSPDGFVPSKEHSPSYPTALVFVPDQGGIQNLVYEKCKSQGVEFIFSTWAVKLLRNEEHSNVEGLICQDVDGEYTKILAKKAVVLATGDFGNNMEMVTHFTPWAHRVPVFFSNVDAKGNPTNTGDGQKMGVWVGAKMEDGPLAPMIHTMGGPLGVDPYFLANLEGKRFMNEDVGAQHMANALARQPGQTAWQIFDDNWPDQLSKMAQTHASVNHVVAADKNPKIPELANTLGRSTITSREDLETTEGIVIANTIKELIGKLELDDKSQAAMLESINRYNELCDKGVDEDFGKTSKRLFSIKKAPFYAAKMPVGVMLVVLGGLTCDPDTGNVLDDDYKPIKGLYAAGNTMGGRFLMDYPVVAPGASHGMALTYGRLVGTTVAKL